MSELYMSLAQKLHKYDVKGKFEDSTIEEFKNLPSDIVEEIAKAIPNNLRGTNGFLGTKEGIRFYVFDLPRVITCPGATPNCLGHCYQKKAVKRHKGAGKDSLIEVHQKINLYRSLQEDFVDNMVKEILELKSKGNKIYIRLHACGDFYNEEYLKKWIEIAKRVEKQHQDYYFMAYTKSFEILDSVMNDKKWMDEVYERNGDKVKDKYYLGDTNIHFMGSVMDDTNEKDMNIIEKYQMTKYIATSQNITNVIINDCKKKCAECMECYENPKSDIVTLLR